MIDLQLDFPTDRSQDSPDVGVGVDTIRLAGPTDDHLLDHLRIQQIERSIDFETGEMTDRRRGCRARLRCGLTHVDVRCRRTESEISVELELSLPRMFLGHNRDPLCRDLLGDAIDTTLAVLGDEVPGLPAPEALTLQRIDLARDFHGLASPSRTLEVLRHRGVPRATRNSQYRRPDGRLQTIYCGSPSQYLLRAYAKGHELERVARRSRDPDVRAMLSAWSEVSQDQLRCELQLRAPVLRRVGIHTTSDCTSESLYAISREYFERARWDEPFSGSTLHDRLTAALQELTPADARNLMVYLFTKMNGLDGQLGRHALERVRPIARRHRLLEPSDEGRPRRLDFETGEERIE